MLYFTVVLSALIWPLIATPTGNHTCTGVVKHPVTVHVNVTEPVTFRTYTWCLRVPPRCSTYTIQLKDRIKIHTEMHNRTITVCCKGYVEINYKCVPACPPQMECPFMHCNRTNHCYCTAGYTGLYCNDPCDRGFWGSDCSRPCDCPPGYTCHHLTGDCMLDDRPPSKIRRTTSTTTSFENPISEKSTSITEIKMTKPSTTKATTSPEITIPTTSVRTPTTSTATEAITETTMRKTPTTIPSTISTTISTTTPTTTPTTKPTTTPTTTPSTEPTTTPSTEPTTTPTIPPTTTSTLTPTTVLTTLTTQGLLASSERLITTSPTLSNVDLPTHTTASLTEVTESRKVTKPIFTSTTAQEITTKTTPTRLTRTIGLPVASEESNEASVKFTATTARTTMAVTDTITTTTELPPTEQIFKTLRTSSSTLETATISILNKAEENKKTVGTTIPDSSLGSNTEVNSSSDHKSENKKSFEKATGRATQILPEEKMASFTESFTTASTKASSIEKEKLFDVLNFDSHSSPTESTRDKLETKDEFITTPTSKTNSVTKGILSFRENLQSTPGVTHSTTQISNTTEAISVITTTTTIGYPRGEIRQPTTTPQQNLTKIFEPTEKIFEPTESMKSNYPVTSKEPEDPVDDLKSDAGDTRKQFAAEESTISKQEIRVLAETSTPVGKLIETTNPTQNPTEFLTASQTPKTSPRTEYQTDSSKPISTTASKPAAPSKTIISETLSSTTPITETQETPTIKKQTSEANIPSTTEQVTLTTPYKTESTTFDLKKLISHLPDMIFGHFNQNKTSETDINGSTTTKKPIIFLVESITPMTRSGVPLDETTQNKQVTVKSYEGVTVPISPHKEKSSQETFAEEFERAIKRSEINHHLDAKPPHAKTTQPTTEWRHLTIESTKADFSMEKESEFTKSTGQVKQPKQKEKYQKKHKSKIYDMPPTAQVLYEKTVTTSSNAVYAEPTDHKVHSGVIKPQKLYPKSYGKQSTQSPLGDITFGKISKSDSDSQVTKSSFPKQREEIDTKYFLTTNLENRTTPRAPHTWYSHAREKAKIKDSMKNTKTTSGLDNSNFHVKPTDNYDRDSNDINAMQTSFVENGRDSEDDVRVNQAMLKKIVPYPVTSNQENNFYAEATLISGCMIVLLTTLVTLFCLTYNKRHSDMRANSPESSIMAYSSQSETLNMAYETVYPLTDGAELMEAATFFCPTFTNNYAERINRELSELSYDQPRPLSYFEPKYEEVRLN